LLGNHPSSSVSRSSAKANGAEICDYVAQLQLHMALQARNLIPGFTPQAQGDSRLQLLHQTQVDLEKTASRQWF
jgi:hypothetical protein